MKLISDTAGELSHAEGSIHIQKLPIIVPPRTVSGNDVRRVVELTGISEARGLLPRSQQWQIRNACAGSKIRAPRAKAGVRGPISQAQLAAEAGISLLGRAGSGND